MARLGVTHGFFFLVWLDKFVFHSYKATTTCWVITLHNDKTVNLYSSVPRVGHLTFCSSSRIKVNDMWRQQWQFGAVNKPAWLIPYPQTLSLKAIILIVLKRNFQVIHHIIDLPSHNWLTNQTISPHLLCNHLTISRARFDTSFDTLWHVLTHCFEHEILTLHSGGLLLGYMWSHSYVLVWSSPVNPLESLLQICESTNPKSINQTYCGWNKSRTNWIQLVHGTRSVVIPLYIYTIS